MTQLIVLSAIGTDRTGVVQDITKVILDCGGNIEESRMTTLGAEFAMLMLVSGNWHTLNRLETAPRETVNGRQPDLHDSQDRRTRGQAGPNALRRRRREPGPTRASCSISPTFSRQHDIEIADVATRSYAAAHTGAQMFAVQMAVNVPSSIHIAQLRDEFLELCDRLNLDAILEPVKS